MPADQHVANLMRSFIHNDPMVDAVAVAAADLGKEKRADVAHKLWSGRVFRVAPHIYGAPSPLAEAFSKSFGDVPAVTTPAPHLVAAALCRQHGWRLAMPVAFARFMLGIEERPERLPVIPYDQPEPCTYPQVGLTLIPASASLFAFTSAGQALAQGLPKEASEVGLLRIALEAAQGLLGEAEFRSELQADIDAGHLGEREYLVARAIVTADTGPKPLRRAPPTFEPPTGDVVRLDGWCSLSAPDGSEYLVARHVTGHPYAGKNGRAIRTAALVWIDETLGWAKTRSRVYRLGLKVTTSP